MNNNNFWFKNMDLKFDFLFILKLLRHFEYT